MTDELQPNPSLQSQLSAFIDDELPAAETDLLVRRLVKDQELKQTMSRYLLVGEALRAAPMGERRSGRLSPDFSQRVASALDQEEKKTVTPFPVRNWSGWLKPAAGMALAASVALVALLSFGARPGAGESGLVAKSVVAPGGAQAAGGVATSNSYVVPMATNAPSVPIPAARLTNYVVAHSEFASPLGRRNTLTGLLVSDQEQAPSVTAEGKSAFQPSDR